MATFPNSIEAGLPDCPGEIFLQPGEVHFGDRHTRIRTLLGSCVAITLWHPERLIGGMCHYLLASPPGRQRREQGFGSYTGRDGRYAEGALRVFVDELHRNGTRPDEYQVKMFGGGEQFTLRPGAAGCTIPDDNIQAGRELLAHYGFALSAEHLGGHGHRSVIFDVATGDVWMRHVNRRMEEEA